MNREKLEAEIKRCKERISEYEEMGERYNVIFYKGMLLAYEHVLVFSGNDEK